MYQFWMRGIIKGSDNQKSYEVLHKYGRLSGDKTLVQALKSNTSDIMDAKAAIQTMRELCGQVQIWGDYPE